MSWFARQFLDLAAYWLLPFICFLLPSGIANGIARWVARREWFYRERTENALNNARAVTKNLDEAAWKQTFRLVHFLDAVDVWHGRFSSDARLRNSLVSMPAPAQWPRAKQLVLLGTHLGPSTLFLRCLAMAGYRPRLVYRQVQQGLYRQAPVFRAYLAWRIAYLRKVCRGGEIQVPGGRDALGEALKTAGDGLVLLIDAPSGRADAVQMKLKGYRLPINPGGLHLAAGLGPRSVQFAMYWDTEQDRRQVVLEPAVTLEDGDRALASMEDFLSRWLEHHPAQWQLWSTARPVLEQGD